MSKAIEKAELRDQFLETIRLYAREWASYENKTPEQRCNGLAFSILALLDGAELELPAFDLVARPHPDTKAYHKANGENWVVDGQVINDDVHLHDMYYR